MRPVIVGQEGMGYIENDRFHSCFKSGLSLSLTPSLTYWVGTLINLYASDNLSYEGFSCLSPGVTPSVKEAITR